MNLLRSNPRLLITVAAVVASVFLFACQAGPDERTGDLRADRPARHAAPAQASAAAVPPPQAAAPPAEPAPAAQTPAAPDAPAAAAEVPAHDGPVEDATAGAGDANHAAPAAPARRPSARTPGDHVYSNKDLEQYRHLKEEFGLRDGVVVFDPTRAKPKDEVTRNTGMTAAQRDAEIESTRQKISDLMRELEYQKKRVLPLENPFVPRVEVSEADKLAEAGLNNAERLRRVKERMSEIETEVGSLQHHLADLYNTKPAGGPDAGGETADQPVE